MIFYALYSTMLYIERHDVSLGHITRCIVCICVTTRGVIRFSQTGRARFAICGTAWYYYLFGNSTDVYFPVCKFLSDEFFEFVRLISAHYTYNQEIRRLEHHMLRELRYSKN